MINKGSEWNIWDLHVHTPASIFDRFGNEEDVWEKYILDLESLSSKFKVIGVNDYFFIDGYERLLKEKNENKRLKNLLLIPVLEFRIEKFAGVDFKNLKRINFHIIFSPDLSLETIKSQFLNTLEQAYTLETDGSEWSRAITRQSVEELGNKIKAGVPSSQLHKYGSDLLEGFNNLNLKEEQIFKSLEKDCFKGKYLIAIGKTEWDELPWTDASIATKKSIINKADIVFTASASVENYKNAKEKLTSQAVNDFLFDCSDAHSFSNIITEKDRIGNCLNWLKCDISFDGLRQTLIEKDERLFVGDEPQILKNLNIKRTKYIDSIKIDHIQDYDSSEGVWFKDVEIPLNKELVVIIGNKGKGKSAIADIISLCGNYKGSHNDFSFLKSNRFNEKQGKIAKNFEAQITWLSGNIDKKILNERVSESAVENVKYLPQGYFESLTNDHESIDDFNKEIENVVFTHLSESEKLGKKSFKELIEFQTTVSNEEINLLKLRLGNINKSLFEKEKKLNPIYKTSIVQQIQQKNEELKALIELPIIKNPNDDPSIAVLNSEINGELEKINQELEVNNVSFTATAEKKGSLLIEISKLKVIKQRIENKVTELENFKIEIKQELVSYT